VNSKQKSYLLKLVRNKLENGKNLTIFGWKPSNHNQQTREYESSGRVRFFAKEGRISGINGDLILMTRFVSHADQERIQNIASNVYTRVISMGVLRDVLNECSGLIVKIETVPKQNTGVADKTATQTDHLNLNELENHIMETEEKMDQFDRFANQFNNVATLNPEGCVSSIATTAMLRDLAIEESARKLVGKGWLIPVRAGENKKVSKYKAGKKLQERINKGKMEEPEDPIEKIRYLIAKEDYFKMKQAEAQMELERWETQLERVNSAKQIMNELSEL
jgi:hypothetical protein